MSANDSWLKRWMEQEESPIPLRIKIYQAIKAGVLAGALRPGEETTEIKLVSELGVSRTPIREALQRLEAEGWIERVPGKASVVTTISEKDVRDLYLMRSALESLAVDLSTTNLTDDALKEIHSIIEEMEFHSTRNNVQAVAAKNKKFHWHLVRLSDSRQILSALKSIYEQIDRIRESTLLVPGRLKETLEQHRSIYRALEKRDHKHAAELVQQHILKACELLLETIRTRDVTPETKPRDESVK